MRKLLAVFAFSSALALPVAAQEHAPGAAHVNPVTSTQAIQNQFMGWIISAAEQVSEPDYGYRPISTVRTMGQLFGHVANANFMICATIRGQQSPSTADLEKGTKAEIVAGLKASAEYCAEAAKAMASKHHDPVTIFGMSGDVTWGFNFNSSHNAEHYGNLVTYLRMKGLVPPSSQGGM